MRTWLKNLREEHGLKQSEMAEKIGISTTYYFYIENGERQKSLDLSLGKKIADIFCLDIAQIVKYEAELQCAEA